VGYASVIEQYVQSKKNKLFWQDRVTFHPKTELIYIEKKIGGYYALSNSSFPNTFMFGFRLHIQGSKKQKK